MDTELFYSKNYGKLRGIIKALLDNFDKADKQIIKEMLEKVYIETAVKSK